MTETDQERAERYERERKESAERSEREREEAHERHERETQGETRSPRRGTKEARRLSTGIDRRWRRRQPGPNPHSRAHKTVLM